MKLPKNKLRRPSLIVAGTALTLTFGALALASELGLLALADEIIVVQSVISEYPFDPNVSNTLTVDGGVDLDISPLTFGAISVGEIDITASTSNQYGYTLTLSSETGPDGLQCDVAASAGFGSNKCSTGDGFSAIHTSTNAYAFSTVLSPSLLKENSWGFAVAQSDTGVWRTGFSDNYEVGNNRFGQAERSLWATVPSGDTIFRRTLEKNADNDLDNLEMYFGVRSSRDTKLGVYKATVTITILPNDLANMQEFFIEKDPSMFAVKYDSSDNNWQIADERNPNGDWFSYGEARWANAVIPKAEFLGKLHQMNIGDVVEENWILSWLVYIPRFRYQVNTLSSALRPADVTQFNIEFENMFTNFYSKKTIGEVDSTGDWVTHPAFTLGNTELSGFWISKFPVTNVDNGRYGAEPNAALITKTPADWWNILRNANWTSFRRPNSLALETDTRMIKNAEWAAVAYLSLSDYGRGTVEVRWSSGNTGSGANWKSNTAQTTTGNPTGVYDMNGRTTLVLGNFDNNVGASGFTDFPNTNPGAANINILTTDDLNNCPLTECLGQGLFEIAGWHGVSATLPNAANPWITRGNNGIYAFSNSTGAASTTRVVLTRKELLKGYCAKNSNAEICQ